MDVEVEACKESVVEGQHSKHTHGETPVPTIVLEPHLEVLGHIVAVLGTDSGFLGNCKKDLYYSTSQLH